MNRNSPLSLLATLALLGSLRREGTAADRKTPTPNPDEQKMIEELQSLFGKENVRVLGGEPNFGKPDTAGAERLLQALLEDDQPEPIQATQHDHSILLAHQFEELPNRARKMLSEMLEELKSVPVEDIDTLALVALVKNHEPPEKCKGCGGYHDPNTRMISGVVSSGNSDWIDSVIRVGLETRSAESNATNAYHEGDKGTVN